MRVRFDFPDLAWCWLDFGVAGRFEQSWSCVQENGLLFALAEGADPEPVRQAFLPFAQAVNQALDDCGFALCQSQIMAGNVRYCLSEHEWRQRFVMSFSDSVPAALPKLSNFFDLRLLFGEH